jgi:hypothetical protein
MVTEIAEESSLLSNPLHQKSRIRRVQISQQYNIAQEQEPNHEQQSDNEIIARQIDKAAAGLPDYVAKQLTDLYHLSSENALDIVNFILAQKSEVNMSDIYRLNMISTLVLLSNFLNHICFKDMKQEKYFFTWIALERMKHLIHCTDGSGVTMSNGNGL